MEEEEEEDEEEEEAEEEQGRRGRGGADLKTRTPHNFVGNEKYTKHIKTYYPKLSKDIELNIFKPRCPAALQYVYICSTHLSFKTVEE